MGRYLGAERAVPASAPAPGGNGGKRVPAPQRLTPAPAAEADVAMLAWAGGPLEQAAHGLFATRPWTWRRLTLADLRGRRPPARPVAGALRAGPWPTGAEGTLHVSWLCTHPEDARIMLRALVDLAAAAGGRAPRDGGPGGGLARAALEQAGWELHPVRVCARPL